MTLGAKSISSGIFDTKSVKIAIFDYNFSRSRDQESVSAVHVYVLYPYALLPLYTIYISSVYWSICKRAFLGKIWWGEPSALKPSSDPPNPSGPHQHDQHPERMPSALAPSAPPIPSRGIEPHRNPNTRLLSEDQPNPEQSFW